MLFRSQSANKVIIGMIHVKALPGTPEYDGEVGDVFQTAVEEAILLERLGFDAIMIENMHDVPYLKRKVGPEITAAMAVIGNRIRQATNIPCGIQILAGANKEAVAVALSADLSFIRSESFVYSHVADEGLMDGDAGELLRYRKSIGANQIEIFTDVQKKHSSHAITGDLLLSDHIKSAELFLSDGLIITGGSTGQAANIGDVRIAKKVSAKPIIIGSGITENNIKDYWGYADGFIVGTSLKKDNYWGNSIDEQKAEAFIDEIGRLRRNGD